MRNQLRKLDEVIELEKGKLILLDKKIYIDETHNSSIQEISNKCSKLRKEKNIELVIIEYSQLIQEDLETIEN